MILNRKSLLFSKEEQTTAEVSNGNLLIKNVVMKTDNFGITSKKSEQVLFCQPLQEIGESSLAPTSDKHRFQLYIQTGSVDGAPLPVCIIHIANYPGFLKLLQNDFVISHSFFVGDSISGEVSDSLVVDFYREKFTITFSENSPVACTGDMVTHLSKTSLSAAHGSHIGFQVTVAGGQIDSIQTLKNKVRLGAIAIFTPFPAIAMLTPNKKVFETSEIDNRILEIKIFGSDFQLLTHAPATLGNLQSLSDLEDTFRSSTNWKK